MWPPAWAVQASVGAASRRPEAGAGVRPELMPPIAGHASVFEPAAPACPCPLLCRRIGCRRDAGGVTVAARAFTARVFAAMKSTARKNGDEARRGSTETTAAAMRARAMAGLVHPRRSVRCCPGLRDRAGLRCGGIDLGRPSRRCPASWVIAWRQRGLAYSPHRSAGTRRRWVPARRRGGASAGLIAPAATRLSNPRLGLVVPLPSGLCRSAFTRPCRRVGAESSDQAAPPRPGSAMPSLQNSSGRIPCSAVTGSAWPCHGRSGAGAGRGRPLLLSHGPGL